MSLNWFADINLKLKKLLRWPLETIWKVSPLNFIAGPKRQSTVMWKWRIYVWMSYPEKLFLNQQSLFIYRSMSLWSRHVLFEYINMIFDTSIRILNTLAQLTMPVLFFVKEPITVSISHSHTMWLCFFVHSWQIRDRHLAKYETIGFSLQGSWNLKPHQRLRDYSNQLQPGK